MTPKRLSRIPPFIEIIIVARSYRWATVPCYREHKCLLRNRIKSSSPYVYIYKSPALLSNNCLPHTATLINILVCSYKSRMKTNGSIFFQITVGWISYSINRTRVGIDRPCKIQAAVSRSIQCVNRCSVILYISVNSPRHTLFFSSPQGPKFVSFLLLERWPRIYILW